MSDRATFGRLRHSQDAATIAPVRAIRRFGRATGRAPIVGLVLLCAHCGPPTNTQAQPPASAPVVEVAPQVRPDFLTVAKTVSAHLASQRNFEANDLLTQSQINKALDAVLIAGWDVPDREDIVRRGIADGAFLSKELASPAGRKFMRQVARQPGGYSRLDRLSATSGGQQLVRNLIRQKEGYQFIAYLATTSGGHNLGRMAANTRNGVDLNKPTGRIYTVADLLAALKTSYDRSK